MSIVGGCGCSGHVARPRDGPLCPAPREYAAYDEAAAAACVREHGAAGVSAELALRCYTSNLIGREASLVLHGGGNTSVKLTQRNAFGEEVEVLCVKGSGYNLDTIVPRGFPAVSLAHLRKMLTLESLSDPEMVNQLRGNMLDASSPTPSVETLLHAMLPHKFVDHSHADAIVALADHEQAEAERCFREAFAGQLRFAVVPYHMPGFELAGAARKVLAAHAGQPLDCIVLLKHGLFTWGATARESYEAHVKAVGLAERYLHARRADTALTPRPLVVPSPFFFDKVLCTLRGVLSELDGARGGWVVSYRESADCAAFAQSEEAATLSQIGPITPDHVIRTKGKPLLLRGLTEERFYTGAEAAHARVLEAETPKGDAALRAALADAVGAYVAAYKDYFARNNARVGGAKQALDPLPRVLLLEHFGLLTADRDAKACAISADIYEHSVGTILASHATGEGGFQPISEAELFDVEYWDLEQAKLKLGAAPRGALQGKVALVTGGGSGIGLATAQLFAKEGACVFIADLLEERVKEGVAAVAKAGKSKPAVGGCVLDVADRAQVEDAFHKCVMLFGGVDVVVSNAGIVVQAEPGFAACAPSQLELSMNVNFYAHQHVSSAAVRRMLAQRTGGALLYNVSKAPLNPGPKMGPYVVAKAATLALMRQYCIEYGEYGITANAVNADRVRTNLFDLALVEKRANARGLTAQQYFSANLLQREVLADDVAAAFLALATATKTTGSIFTVDGGNIAAAPR